MQVAPEASFECGKGFLLEQIRQGRGEGGEADGVTGLERGEPQVLGQRRLADAAGAAEQEVLVLLDEVQPEELLV